MSLQTISLPLLLPLQARSWKRSLCSSPECHPRPSSLLTQQLHPQWQSTNQLQLEKKQNHLGLPGHSSLHTSAVILKTKTHCSQWLFLPSCCKPHSSPPPRPCRLACFLLSSFQGETSPSHPTPPCPPHLPCGSASPPTPPRPCCRWTRPAPVGHLYSSLA